MKSSKTDDELDKTVVKQLEAKLGYIFEEALFSLGDLPLITTTTNAR